MTVVALIGGLCCFIILCLVDLYDSGVIYVKQNLFLTAFYFVVLFLLERYIPRKRKS